MSQATLLDGIVVLDATQVMAGPYCAMLLADMGARVIKVEPPAGDSTRSMAGARGSDSPAFNAVNRGKLGIVLDLQQPSRAATSSSGWPAPPTSSIENYRPGVMARLGLDYAALQRENPRLIYASISGHGQTGPWAAKGGFDLIAQGLSGLMSVTGNADGAPVKAGVPLTDLGAGLFALIGILAALHHRATVRRGPARRHVARRCRARAVGVGSHRVLHVRPGAGAAWLGASHDARRTRPSAAPTATSRSAPPTIATSRSSRACSAIHEWLTDARFAADHQRVAHRDELAALIEADTVEASRARSGSASSRRPASRAARSSITKTRLTTPQALAREMTVDVEHPTLGPLRTLGTPIKMSATPLNPKRRAPMLGEHTDDVLAEAGYSGDEIEQLRYCGRSVRVLRAFDDGSTIVLRGTFVLVHV